MRAKPWEVPDRLWERIEPLLPKKQRRFRYPGRRPLDDRRVLQGDLVRAAHRDRLGAPAARARLRLRDDRLAQAARLAAGGRVGEVARAAARRVARRRSARVGAGGRRLKPPASEKRATKPVRAQSTEAGAAASTISS